MAAIKHPMRYGRVDFPVELAYEYFARDLAQRDLPKGEPLAPMVALFGIKNGALAFVTPFPDAHRLWASESGRHRIEQAIPTTLKQPASDGMALGVVIIYESAVHSIDVTHAPEISSKTPAQNVDATPPPERIIPLVMIEIRHSDGSEAGWLPILPGGGVKYQGFHERTTLPIPSEMQVGTPGKYLH